MAHRRGRPFTLACSGHRGMAYGGHARPGMPILPVDGNDRNGTNKGYRLDVGLPMIHNHEECEEWPLRVILPSPTF